MTDATADFNDRFRIMMERQLVKGAVQTTITCPRSGVILDQRRAVVVTVKRDGKESVACLDGKAYDAIANELAERCAKEGVTIELLDGRVLFRRR